MGTGKILDVKPGLDTHERHKNKIKKRIFFGDFPSTDFSQKL